MTGILWLTRSLKFLDYITEYGLDFDVFLNVLILILPNLLLLVVPLSLLISIIMTYSRMIQNNEIIVLQNNGINRKSLISPIFFLSLICFIFCIFISFYLIPVSLQKLSDIKENMKNNVVNVLLNNDNFNSVDNITLYTKKKDGNKLQSIMIFIKDKNDKNNLIYAQNGYIDNNIIELSNGTMEEVNLDNKNKMNIIFFEKYKINLNDYYNDDIKDKNRDFETFTIDEIIDHKPNKNDKKSFLRYIYEINYRIISSLLCFAMAFISGSLILGKNFNRTGNSKLIFKTTSVSIAIFSSILYSMKFGEDNAIGIYGSIVLTLFSLIFSLLTLRDKKYA